MSNSKECEAADGAPAQEGSDPNCLADSLASERIAVNLRDEASRTCSDHDAVVADDSSSAVGGNASGSIAAVKDTRAGYCGDACESAGDDITVEKTSAKHEADSDDRGGSNEIGDEWEHGSGDEAQDAEAEHEEEEEEEDESVDDDGDDDGWITPSNLKQVQAEMQQQHGGSAKADPVAVGCVTTDFAMQNVLIQMGLNVVSCDGLIIKKARSYVLRCAACFKITTNMEKQFCYHCGNKMLQKVSATVNEDGSMSYHLSRRRPVTTRGLKFSLPMPKGGKHAVNPRLVEDQPTPQQRASKMAQRRAMDVFADDYVAQASPFAVHDVVSRAARLGIRPGSNPEEHYWNRRNPNEVRRHGRRK